MAKDSIVKDSMVSAADQVKSQIESSNEAIRMYNDEINKLSMENKRLVELKKEMENLKAQAKLAQDREKALADQAGKIEAMNKALQLELGI